MKNMHDSHAKLSFARTLRHMQNSVSLLMICFSMLHLIHDFAALFSGRATSRQVVLPLGGVTSVVPGLRVTVETGAVWMSLRGQPDDVTLIQGESVCTGGGTVFEALKPSVLSISC